MKKSLSIAVAALGMAATLAAFSPGAYAQAACAGCSAWQTFGGDTLAGSVTVNDGVSFFNSGDVSGQQPGIYGAGFTISNNNFAMTFDADLSSWDSYVAPVNALFDGTGWFDAFIVTVSTTDFYWNLPQVDPIVSSASTWVWGGNNWADGQLDSYITAPGGTDSISMAGPGTFYVSLVLDTKTQPFSDDQHPSWGSFHVNVVPEPETYAMLLAGLGLMGFVARRRQRNLAAA